MYIRKSNVQFLVIVKFQKYLSINSKILCIAKIVSSNFTIWRSSLKSSSIVCPPGRHHSDVGRVKGRRSRERWGVWVCGMRMSRMRMRVSSVGSHATCRRARVSRKCMVRVRVYPVLPRRRFFPTTNSVQHFQTQQTSTRSKNCKKTSNPVIAFEKIF